MTQLDDRRAIPRLPAADGVRPARLSRRARLTLMAGLVVVLSVVGVWAVAFSPLLGVRTVQVRGATLVTAAQVRAAAGVADGTPLLRLDTDAVARRIEQRLPEVRTAAVDTSLPSTVTITIVERQAVGYLDTAGGVVLVDAAGVQFHQLGTTPTGLPLFAVPSGTAARADAAATAQVAAALGPQLRALVTKLHTTAPDAITLVVQGGRTVVWGGPQRSADKARLLPALLATRATYINLSNPDEPFTR